MTHLPVTCSMKPWDTSMGTSYLPMQRGLVLCRTETGYRRSQGSPQTDRDVEVPVYISPNLQP